VYDPVGWLNITFEPEGADDVIKYVLRVLLKEYDEPVIVNEPEIVVLLFTLNPVVGSTEAVTLPVAICDKLRPTTPEANM
jgi:hypothetical protein